jgi:cytochrome c oxidase cbb3-type subunit III
MKIHKYKCSSIVAILILLPAIAVANDGNVLDWSFDNIILILSLLILALAFGVLYSVTSKLIDMQKKQLGIMDEVAVTSASASGAEEPGLFTLIYQKLTDYVPVEKEKDIDLGHNYDGIRELDNSLPPWWLYLFYITIAFSFVYIYWIHFGPGSTIKQEYQEEVADLERMRRAYLAQQAFVVDEDNVFVVEDADKLAQGREIFVRNCAACHLESGAGSIGPNLTDEYYIHGGGIKNTFSVIKHGVPEKGMISWKTQLTPEQMQNVASYIVANLAGTNLPGKEPEGDKWIPKEDDQPSSDLSDSDDANTME